LQIFVCVTIVTVTRKEAIHFNYFPSYMKKNMSKYVKTVISSTEWYGQLY